MDNRFTFGKYKGRLVTDVLLLNPDYFGWCTRNVGFFAFSIRDFEIYISYYLTCRNHESFALTGGYVNKKNIMSFIKKVRIPRGDYEKFPNDKYLYPKDVNTYLSTRAKNK